MSHITQSELNKAFELSNKTNVRPSPFVAKKKSTKQVQMGNPGELIETWIDVGDTIQEEVSRVVPYEGKHIIIMDNLKNSTTKQQKYFIPYEDFIERYSMIDGSIITNDMSSEFEVVTMVQAKGIVTCFRTLREDTITGLYEQPPSWGKGIASGANEEGYWMASPQKPEEWYFMPITHFERDYIITTHI